MLKSVEIILYVSDQNRSCDFYTRLFERTPDLHVPGMTSFKIAPTFSLGLMPNQGIAKILTPKLPHPDRATGIPRCELYWMTDEPEKLCNRAIEEGAILISPLAERDWGHTVCYLADHDGHVLAFAKETVI